MGMKRKHAAFYALSTGLVWVTWPGWAAAEHQFSAELGVQFETGEYGTSETTDTWSIPLNLWYSPIEKLDFDFFLPFYRISNTSTTIAEGVHGSDEGSQHVETTETQMGLGDASLKTGYTLTSESNYMFSVRPLLFVKFPTGDEDNGLGTGEFDYGGGLSVSKWLGDWQPYGELLYINSGKPDNLDLENYWSYTLSLEYEVSKHLRPEVSLVGSTNPFVGADDVQSLEFILKYWPTDNIRLKGYVSFGLTDATSDFAGGIFIAFIW